MRRGVPVPRTLPPSQNLRFPLPLGSTQYAVERPPRREEPGAWPKRWTLFARDAAYHEALGAASESAEALSTPAGAPTTLRAWIRHLVGRECHGRGRTHRGDDCRGDDQGRCAGLRAERQPLLSVPQQRCCCSRDVYA